MTGANAIPLKGRKKFLSDLQDACQKSYVVKGLQVIALTRGEDEGSIICELGDDNDNYLPTLNLLVSETSEYPNYHHFLCFVQHDNPPEYIQHAANEIPDRGSLTIDETIDVLLNLILKHISGEHEAEDDGDNDDDEDFLYEEHFDDDYGLVSAAGSSLFDFTCLRRDFNEIVAAGYKPGSIRLGSDGFCLSVSIPVVSLAHAIPPQALMAWDQRLLSKTQHLTLVITGMGSVWPILQKDGALASQFAVQHSARLGFRVGLTRSYKPSKNLVRALIRCFDIRQEASPDDDDDDEEVDDSVPTEIVCEPDEAMDVTDEDVNPVEASTPQAVDDEELPSTFHFSLSTSMESLMHDRFVEVVHLRIQYGLGWAAAELLAAESQRLQQKPEDLLVDMFDELNAADMEENQLGNTYNLPIDPLVERQRDDALNLPLLAFSYLLRRLTLCTRFCLICYQKIKTNFVALKPYVCDSGLCAYQYYNLNRGPSLEYEICTRSSTVELLVSLAFLAAETQSLEGSLPTGLGLMIPSPPGSNSLQQFDILDNALKASAMAVILKTLPSISDMKAYLEKQTRAGRTRPKVNEMDPKVPPEAWLLLRWCVASCTAHLEELTAEEDQIRNLPKGWRQFRFIVGSPDAEAKLEKAKEQAALEDANARSYPSLYAFHGSPSKNWHSIIRHGLWFKNIAHGRAYGNGVYLAKDYNTSVGYSKISSGPATVRWPLQRLPISRCTAVAEVVNHPKKFVSYDPHLVVDKTDWIVCRYLLVDCYVVDHSAAHHTGEITVSLDGIPAVQLDPAHPLTYRTNKVLIPEPSYKLHKLLEARQLEFTDEDFDDEDQDVFDGKNFHDTVQGSQREPKPALVFPRDPDEWKHNSEWVTTCMPHVLPPPTDSMSMATMSLQRELQSMLREQARVPDLNELGWYIPPEFIGDNLFQWIVELHSFEKELPVAKDMKARNVNSLVFEIRFPPTFPHSPPFFRILKPRFLPFIQGGGGHVTGGGSMCMDLLTADNWLPSYSIPAILLQIKLAISNLDPRPARLAANWDVPYTMQEAIAGFQRAAHTHGWKVPEGLERLV